MTDGWARVLLTQAKVKRRFQLISLLLFFGSLSLFQGRLEMRAFATESSAKGDKAPTVSLIQGFGAAYGFSSTRLGIYSWEMGLLNAGTNMSSFGLIKIFRHRLLYTGIGPILFNASLLGPTSPGLFTAIGIEQILPFGIICRIELNAEATFDGSTQASSALQIGWGLW